MPTGAEAPRAGVPGTAGEYDAVQSRRRLLGWLLYGFGLSLLVALIVRTGPWRMLEALLESRWQPVALAILALAIGQTLRGIKWAYLIGQVQPGVDRPLVVGCYFTNILVSYWTPARSGEALAPLLLASRCGTPKRLGLAVILVDRMADVAFLAAALVGSALYLGSHAGSAEGSGTLRTSLYAAAAFAAVLGAAGVAVLRATRPGLAARQALEGDLPPEDGLFGRLTGLFWKLRAAIAQVVRPRRLGVLWILTMAAWLFDFANLYWMVNAVTPIRFVESSVAQSVAAGASLASFVPGGIGVATASYVVVADLLGADWQRVAAAGVLAVVLNQVTRFALALAAGAHWGRAAKRLR
ncbi:MAG TPA: lysylphosphatidylglycerol synthase transmembrane domain-containing protein [Thermoanaerobaculia bacterium]|nr:lysylphosphatidylglycerol synthase transmembrane domain-containing protein [Thermoanaerobaculia bacterium]